MTLKLQETKSIFKLINAANLKLWQKETKKKKNSNYNDLLGNCSDFKSLWLHVCHSGYDTHHSQISNMLYANSTHEPFM